VKRLKTTAKKASLLLASLVALVASVGLGLWLLRITIATSILEKELAKQGIEVRSLNIENLSLEHAKLTDLELQHALGCVKISSLESQYTIDRLLNEKALDQLEINNAYAKITLPESPPNNDRSLPSSPVEFLKTLPRQFSQRDLPIASLSLSDITLDIESEYGDQQLALDATHSKLSTRIHATGQSLRDKTSYTIDIQQNAPDQIDATLSLSLNDPLFALDARIPGWRNQNPDTTISMVGETHVELKTVISSERINTQLDLSVSSLKASYDVLNCTLEKFTATLKSEDLQAIEGELHAVAKNVERETLSLAPDTPINLSILTNTSQQLTLSTLTPIPWSYDQDFASGRADAQIEMDLSSEDLELNGSIQLHSPQISGYTFKPFTTTLSTLSNSISLETPHLYLEDEDQAILDPGNALITIPEEESEPIDLTFQSSLSPNAFPELPSELALTAFDLKLNSEISDFVSKHKVTLTAPNNDTLLSSYVDTQVKGALSLELDLAIDSSPNSYSGHLGINASNISIQSPELTTSDLALQGTVSLTEIEESTLESSIDHKKIDTLLSQLEAQLDWQANQITTPEIQSQWTGGTINISSPDSNILKIENSVGSGILSYDTVRLEQLYLENSLVGNLSQLSGASSVNGLFEGVPLSLQFQHTLSDLLSDYQLTGSYQLAPTTFTYSDILSRLVPQATGASLSTTFSASGDFYSSPDTTDASLSLQLDQSAIDYPPSQISASGISGTLTIDSLALLDSGKTESTFSIATLQAGDLTAKNADLRFKVVQGKTLQLNHASVETFSGVTSVRPLSIPLDGSDFDGELQLQKVSLEELSRYIDIFDGQLSGSINGTLPFSVVDMSFQPRSGELRLDPTQAAHLSYNAKGLLTEDDPTNPVEKPTFSDRLLKYLNIEPERLVEDSLAQVTIERFDAQIFPPDDPYTPMKIQLSGTARTEDIEIPVVINLRVHGTLTELYNFLIRLNSL